MQEYNSYKLGKLFTIASKNPAIAVKIITNNVVSVGLIAQIPLGSSRHVSTRNDTFDVSNVSRRACQAVLFDKLDTTKIIIIIIIINK